MFTNADFFFRTVLLNNIGVLNETTLGRNIHDDTATRKRVDKRHAFLLKLTTYYIMYDPELHLSSTSLRVYRLADGRYELDESKSPIFPSLGLVVQIWYGLMTICPNLGCDGPMSMDKCCQKEKSLLLRKHKERMKSSN